MRCTRFLLGRGSEPGGDGAEEGAQMALRLIDDRGERRRLTRRDGRS